jgi:hypothetical protein
MIEGSPASDRHPSVGVSNNHLTFFRDLMPQTNFLYWWQTGPDVTAVRQSNQLDSVIT